MPVREEHMGALRAYLEHDLTEFEHLTGRESSPEVAGALFSVAFLEATRIRFGEQGELHEIIRYVAELRQRLARAGHNDIEPRATELLIRGALGEAVDLGQVEESARADAQITVLDDIVTECRMDENELDTFLARVRKATEGRLATQSRERDDRDQ